MSGAAALGLTGLGFAAWPRLSGLLAPSFAFEPIPDLPGFRRIAGSPSAPAALVGIEDSQRTDSAWSGLSTCELLYTEARAPGDIPLAYFSDYRCTFCRRLSPRLADLAQTRGVSLTWHELPLLGPASMQAARAALAARRQGAYAAFHTRLMDSSFVPNPAFLRRLAQDEGIDPDTLIADMDHPGVTRQLAITADLARRFGFFGTPALVIGRTASLGAIPDARIDALIALERSEPAPACA
ncbi:DSBA-like thioredoxin domain-containing protein [Roseovarius litoreus]|jgi:predicted DsbA family dithiol-disulfide isomerase|uniref:DSBA-like thioredoxin domain-containing protein n=1 Tax=Roseovarius litoreus TaxID=1155722 RepID=A0A1M7JZS9_9RHOB|nr:DsbA family protein [Roseovarius litoreus]SHM58233.1 DSBA-like thioredoxin domain-containing protein [Roseovarius litoreus]